MAFAVSVFADDEPAPNPVSNITAAQRWPWNGKVDINYTLTSNEANPIFRVAFYGQIGSGEAFALDALEGDGACGVTFAAGVKRVTWDASVDKPNTESSSVKFGVIALDVTDRAEYLVLDLNNFTMSYNMAGPDASQDDCKTWKMWFKKINAGTYYMGSSTDEYGREPRKESPQYYEDRHQVTITKPFYIGVFECTESQYALITGSTSSAKTPKVNVKVTDDLRGTTYGATWPTYTDHRVDANSFFGKMRKNTGYGLKFDLPTEAQWEMAARDKGDGTYHGDNVWNDGSSWVKTRPIDPEDPDQGYETYYDYSDLDRLGWYQIPNDAVQDVGLKSPGINGLYDIHGNAWEYCIDHITQHLGTSAVTDPVGNTSGNFLTRGGCVWHGDTAAFCRVAMRMCRNEKKANIGFRIAIVF